MAFLSSLRSIFLCVTLALGSGAQALAQSNASSRTQGTSQSVSLVVSQADGAEAVDVSGTGPPWSVVTLTGMAKLSVDLPIVTLNHWSVKTDELGDFRLRLSTAPDFTPTTQVIIQASVSGVASSSATFVVGRPTSGPIIPLLDDMDSP
jgi:hypothetical protein